MGVIINIDEALKLRSTYNVLMEPLNKMIQDQQEAWERKNPIDLLFTRSTIDTFQKTFTSSIGFDHAFSETSDYAVSPIFNTAEGFSATYRTRTFQGSFIITQQTIEDANFGQVRDDATAFTRRWHGDIVEYAIKSISGGFGSAVEWVGGDGTTSRLKLDSADTTDGDVTNPVKNPLFYKDHKTVKRKNSTPLSQSNIFRAGTAGSNTSAIKIGGDDPAQIAKLADYINQVITIMENYRDDNGKRAGVIGQKTIVCGNDPHLKAAINMALSMNMICDQPNVAYQRATLEADPYLLDIPQCENGAGFFIVDRAYNAANHGPEFTERIPFTLDVIDQKRPNGVVYDGRQRFDINVASWRGIAYCLVKDAVSTNTWDKETNFTAITVVDTLVKPVKVVGTVSTKEQA